MLWNLDALLDNFEFLYWSGVVGGCLMLMLFSYPVRKHFGARRNWGRMKTWFSFHVFFGAALSALLIFHTNFLVARSLNGKFALYSMIAVVASGVVGRYLLRRVERGTIWAKMFSYWHVAHIPVIYMVLFFVLIHIYAIHSY